MRPVAVTSSSTPASAAVPRRQRFILSMASDVGRPRDVGRILSRFITGSGVWVWSGGIFSFFPSGFALIKCGVGQNQKTCAPCSFAVVALVLARCQPQLCPKSGRRRVWISPFGPRQRKRRTLHVCIVFTTGTGTTLVFS